MVLSVRHVSIYTQATKFSHTTDAASNNKKNEVNKRANFNCHHFKKQTFSRQPLLLPQLFIQHQPLNKDVSATIELFAKAFKQPPSNTLPFPPREPPSIWPKAMPTYGPFVEVCLVCFSHFTCLLCCSVSTHQKTPFFLFCFLSTATLSCNIHTHTQPPTNFFIPKQ